MTEPAQVIPFEPGGTAGRPVKDLYEIGEIPPLGHVPQRMHIGRTCIAEDHVPKVGCPPRLHAESVVPVFG